MSLKPEDLIGLTPDEVSALQSDGAEAALNTMGDTLYPEKGAPEPVAQAAEDDAEDAASEDKPAVKADTKPAPEVPAAEPASVEDKQAAPVQYEVANSDFKAQRDQLRTQKRELLTKWSAGDMTDEDYAAQVDTLDEQLAAALVEQTRAATLKEVNDQNRKQVQASVEAAENAVMAEIARASKAASLIDYAADPGAAAAFDAMFSAVKGDPASSKLSLAQQAEKAHAAVLAMRGLSAQTPATPTAPAAPKAEQRRVPPSIGGLPNAAPAGVQDDLLEQFGRLSGEDAERFMASLPASQLDKLMRRSDSLTAYAN